MSLQYSSDNDLAYAVTVEARGGGIWAVNYRCPWCGVAVLCHSNTTVQRRDEVALLVQCQATAHCGRPALVLVSETIVYDHAAWHPMHVFPLRRVPYKPDGVPERIARDFEEALNCAAAGFRYGAAVVARRTLQAALIDKGASGKRLVDDIDGTDPEVLPKKLKEAAHQIRLIGNDAAHVDEIDSADLEALLRFAIVVLHHIYVLPHELEQAATLRPRKPPTPAK